MNANLRYFLGAVAAIPMLPLLYFQGKSIQKSIPDLPEAKGAEGKVDIGAEEKLQVLAVGESTIAGVGVEYHNEGFTGLLASRLADLLNVNVSWKVYAKSGYTANKVRTKILPEIEEKGIDIIVVGLGGNDAFTLNRPWNWKKSMRKLILDLRSKFPDTAIAFTNMPPIKDFPAFTKLVKFVIGNLVEIHGATLAKVVREFDNVHFNPEILKIADWVDKLGGKLSTSDFFSDGVHPSKLSYQAWGKDFAEFIVREKVLS